MDTMHFLRVFNDYTQGRHENIDTLTAAGAMCSNPEYVDDNRSLIGHIIENSKSPITLLPVIQALIAAGADPSDPGITSSAHDRAVNLALKKNSYDLALWLIEQGAQVDTVVQQWIRTPANKKQARDVIQLYRGLWERWSDKQKRDYHDSAMIDIIRSELISGTPIDSYFQCEISTYCASVGKEKGRDYWSRGLSWIDDAGRIIGNEDRFLDLLGDMFPRWIRGLDGDEQVSVMDKSFSASPFYSHLPKSWLSQLSSLIARERIARSSSPTNASGPGLRL